MSKLWFKTTATSSGRTISEVVKSGVRIKYPEKSNGNLTFFVRAHDCERVCNTLNGFERVYEKTNFRPIGKLLWRFGIAIGILLAVVAVIILSNYVFSIYVSGLSRIEGVEVERFLKKEGVTVGTKKADLNLEELEIKLMQKFAFSVVDCKFEGVSLVVLVKEELPPPDYVDMQTVKPIISREDAVITRIVNISGTVVVKHGASVKAGDTLIMPVRKVGEAEIDVRAIGEIHGKVWRKKEIFVPKTVIKNQRTGVTKTINCLSFGKLLPETSSPYEYYETEISRVALSGLLPFYKNTVTYYQCMPVEVENPDLKDLSNIVKGALNELRIQVEGESGIYLDDWYSVKEVEGGVIVRVVCEMEMRIDSYYNK